MGPGVQRVWSRPGLSVLSVSARPCEGDAVGRGEAESGRAVSGAGAAGGARDARGASEGRGEGYGGAGGGRGAERASAGCVSGPT